MTVFVPACLSHCAERQNNVHFTVPTKGITDYYKEGGRRQFSKQSNN